MTKLFLLSLALLLTLPAEAGPIHWMKRHPVATSFLAGGAAAAIHAVGLRHCRQGSVENCQAKYGSAWASFGLVTGTNFAVIAATSGCWKDQDRKFCSIFAYGGSAAQAGFGVSQWRKSSLSKPESLLVRGAER